MQRRAIFYRRLMHGYDISLRDVFLTFLLHKHSDENWWQCTAYNIFFQLRCRQECVARFSKLCIV